MDPGLAAEKRGQVAMMEITGRPTSARSKRAVTIPLVWVKPSNAAQGFTGHCSLFGSLPAHNQNPYFVVGAEGVYGWSVPQQGNATNAWQTNPLAEPTPLSEFRDGFNIPSVRAKHWFDLSWFLQTSRCWPPLWSCKISHGKTVFFEEEVYCRNNNSFLKKKRNSFSVIIILSKNSFSVLLHFDKKYVF